jgi:hypothetical protein
VNVSHFKWNMAKQSNPITGLDRPIVFQEAEVPRFQDNWQMKVYIQKNLLVFLKIIMNNFNTSHTMVIHCFHKQDIKHIQLFLT